MSSVLLKGSVLLSVALLAVGCTSPSDSSKNSSEGDISALRVSIEDATPGEWVDPPADRGKEMNDFYITSMDGSCSFMSSTTENIENSDVDKTMEETSARQQKIQTNEGDVIFTGYSTESSIHLKYDFEEKFDVGLLLTCNSESEKDSKDVELMMKELSPLVKIDITRLKND